MAEAQCDRTSDNHRKGSGKRGVGSSEATTEVGSVPNPPCGACKFLRRKCINGCIFAPHFGSDQGAARFAAVHKVFGASNVSKLLSHIPMSRRDHAIVTISYEAQARLSDPVYGCVSTVLALQQQVASLQTELAMVQNQLINSRVAVANAIQSSQQQQQPHNNNSINFNALLLQPAYSNNTSSASINPTNFNSSSLNLFAAADQTALSSQSFEPLHISQPCHDDDDEEEEEEEDEEESRHPLVFANQMLHST